MGFWDDLKNKAQEMNEGLKKNVAQFKNSKFADASMAMCAMVAAADGNIDADERRKTAGFIASNETLKVFEVSDLKKKFEFYCDKLNADFDFGRIECIQAIGKLKGKDDQGRACVQLGIIIGGADGDFDPDERKVVKEACGAVGINPSEFDL